MKARQLVWLWVGFLLAFILGVLVFMPVSQVARLVSIPEEVRLEGVKGTLFSGQIDQMSVRGYRLEDLAYDFQPGCLIQLAICYRLEASTPGMDVNLRYGLIGRTTQLIDSTLNLDATAVAQIPGLLVQPSGRFRLDLTRLEISSRQTLNFLSGDLYWQDAGVVGEDQVIGNYRAQLALENKELQAQLSDTGGLLGLSGDLSLNAAGVYSLDLELDARPGLDPALSGILDSLTKRSGLNTYRYQQNGRLPAAISRQIKRLLGE